MEFYKDKLERYRKHAPTGYLAEAIKFSAQFKEMSATDQAELIFYLIMDLNDALTVQGLQLRLPKRQLWTGDDPT